MRDVRTEYIGSSWPNIMAGVTSSTPIPEIAFDAMTSSSRRPSSSMTYFPFCRLAWSIFAISLTDRENEPPSKSALYPSGRCLFVRFPENDLPRTTRSTFLRISAMDASVFAPSDGMIRQRPSPIFPYRSIPLT